MNATSPPAVPASLWKYGLIIFLAVVLLAIPQIALVPLLDRDEPHFAEAGREMLQSGNFIVPTFNNAPRYNKPPLIYWCETVTFTLFGENAFAARLPSVLATAGTALLLFAWGAGLGSECVGVIAALAYGFCLQAMMQGRAATADGLLIFFMTLTVYAGWKVITTEHASHSSRSYFWDTLLALGFAGGFLAKGPEALLPLLPMLICARHGRKGLVKELIGNFLIALVIILFWAIPAYIETNGDYWRQGLTEGVADRMVTSMQGHGASSLGWYLFTLPLYYPIFFLIGALPLWPLLLTHRKKLFSTGKLDPLDFYLLLNVGLIFLIFSLMVTKLPHYTLPAFPFLALILARRWGAAGLHPRLPTQLSGGFAIVFTLVALVLVPYLLAHDRTPSPVGILVREAQDVLTPQTEFTLVDFVEPNAVWEMRRVVKTYCPGGTNPGIDRSKVRAYLTQPGPRAVVLRTATWDDLHPAIEPSWKIFTARGWNTGHGTRQTFSLTLVVKP